MLWTCVRLGPFLTMLGLPTLLCCVQALEYVPLTAQVAKRGRQVGCCLCVF
jgi:hypothetical protein